MALTDKQDMFCREYLIDLNATQAAIRAGYSEKIARVLGSKNLTKPDIQNRIAELKAVRNEEVSINAAYELRWLVKIDQISVNDIRTNVAEDKRGYSAAKTTSDKVHDIVSKYLTGDATEFMSALVDELISVIDKRDALPNESLNLKGGLIAKHCSDGWRASDRQSRLKANGIEEGLESIISERVTKQIKKELLPGGLLHRSMWK